MAERKDSIGDTTTTTGTGTVNLEASAQVGALIFAGNVTSGATVRYRIETTDRSEWEVGEGVFTDGTPDTLTRVTVYASSNAGSLVNFSAGTKNVSMVITAKDIIGEIAPTNLLKNGNFINNSTNGYGGTPDDWTSSNANPVQGGIPALTKQNLIDGLGVADGDIEGLWPLNEASGDALDLSSNAYNLTDTNTVAASSDGLMALARDFELANSEYFTIADASAPNLEIAGSQTWFAFIKPESIGSIMEFMGKTDNTHVAQRLQFMVLADGSVYATLTGLTTNNEITSDVKLSAGKWYLVCFSYNSSASTLSLWVNGIKKSVTASGTHSDSNSPFNIGCNLAGAGNTAQQFYDGLIQNACVLSVALTDNQVKKLFAMTMYKGQKIRRATTDAYLYEELNQEQVERLRGETIAFSADAYCESTNHGIYITTDGTGGTTTKAHPASANAWERIGLSVTVPSDATYIRYGLLAETTDGNSWFRECSGYIGSSILPYAHSADDWSRFPRLLKMEIPEIYNGYQFEENRWYSYTHVLDVTLLGFSSIIGQGETWMIHGKTGHVIFDFNGVSDAANMDMYLPFIAAGNGALSQNRVVNTIDNSVAQDTGIVGVAIGGTASNLIKFGKTSSTRAANAFGGFTTSGTKGAEGEITCQLN